MEQKKIRTRRVGTVTLGIIMVCFGVLFLLHIFVPMLPYSVIFRCWPVVFIVLGLEILIEHRRCGKEEERYVYDFAAILMLLGMMIFAMVMAAVDFGLNHGVIW